MSEPAKRTVLTLGAAIVTAVFSTLFAITVARLIRHHHTVDSNSAPTDVGEPASSPAPGLAPELQPEP